MVFCICPGITKQRITKVVPEQLLWNNLWQHPKIYQVDTSYLFIKQWSQSSQSQSYLSHAALGWSCSLCPMYLVIGWLIVRLGFSNVWNYLLKTEIFLTCRITILNDTSPSCISFCMIHKKCLNVTYYYLLGGKCQSSCSWLMVFTPWSFQGKRCSEMDFLGILTRANPDELPSFAEIGLAWDHPGQGVTSFSKSISLCTIWNHF